MTDHTELPRDGPSPNDPNTVHNPMRVYKKNDLHQKKSNEGLEGALNVAIDPSKWPHRASPGRAIPERSKPRLQANECLRRRNDREIKKTVWLKFDVANEITGALEGTTLLGRKGPCVLGWANPDEWWHDSRSNVYLMNKNLQKIEFNTEVVKQFTPPTGLT